MKICKICRNSDVLCQACQKKVEEGKIRQFEVDLDRALSDINKEMDFKKAIIVENTLVIFTDNPSLLIGKGGNNVKKIQKKLGKKIKIVKNTDDIKKIASDLLGASVIGMNIRYTPDGEEYVLRVSKKRKRKNKDKTKKILEKMFNKKIDIKYE